MANNYTKIILRHGLREDLASVDLDPAEPAFTYDTNQMFIGIQDAIDEVIVDPFPNAHAVIQDWLDTYEDPTNPGVAKYSGLIVDEDLVIRNIDPTSVDPINSVKELLEDMAESTAFALYARPRYNVEVITENSYNNLFADQNLGIYDVSSGRRSSLYQKDLNGVNVKEDLVGTTPTGKSYLFPDGQHWHEFLRYRSGPSAIAPSVVYLDYSLKQEGLGRTYVRFGTITILNGSQQGVFAAKLTDNNTELWQDNIGGNPGEVEPEEFSNLKFKAQLWSNTTGDIVDPNNIIPGDYYDVVVYYTQDGALDLNSDIDPLNSFKSTITYTVKRWTM